MQTMFTSSIRGRLGTYTVTIYQVSDTPAQSVSTVELAEPPVIRYGRLDVGYGLELMPSYGQLSFIDPGGTIRDTFRGTFQESEYLVTITGPSFAWKGRIQKVSRQRPLATRVYQAGITSLDIYDRLGGLSEVLGTATTDRTLASVIADGLFGALQLDIHWNNDIWPDNIDADDVRLLRFSAEIAGAGRGDYGKVKGQLDQASVYLGLRIFQSVSDATWRVVHRPSIGESVASAQKTVYADPYTWSTANIASDELAITSADIKGEEADVLDICPVLGSLILAGEGAMNLVTDNWFDFRDANGDLIYWTAVGDPDAALTPGGERSSVRLAEYDAMVFQSVEQRLLMVSPETDVLLKLNYRYYSPGGTGVPRAQIRLHATDGTDHYYDATGVAWTTTPTYNQPLSVATDTWTAFEITTAEFPATGDLYLLLTTNVDVTYATDVDARFVDGLGADITDWQVSIQGVEGGVTEEIDRAPELECDTDGLGTWAAASAWTSTRYGATYGKLSEYQAADRLAQQSEDLDVLDTTVSGIHGPQRRLTYDTDENGTREKFIALGLELYLAEGETRGVWVELPSNVL